jgi:hypothetical protein
MKTLTEWGISRAAADCATGGQKTAAEIFSELLQSFEANIVAAEKHAVAVRVGQENSRWAKFQGELASQHIASRMDALEQMLARKVADTILPLFDEGMRARAVSDFCDVLKDHVTPTLREEIVIHAPAELHALLVTGLAGGGISARIEIAGDQDLRTQIAETRIETALAEWRQNLEGLLNR